jgi:uncharacterized lipoprotein
MKPVRQILALVPLLLALSGCHLMRAVRSSGCHESKTYLQAQSVPALKVPAGLDAPDTTSALRLPQLNEPPPPARRGKEPCLDAPPAFKVQQSARSPQA